MNSATNTISYAHTEETPFFFSDLPFSVESALAGLFQIENAGSFLSKKAAKRNHEKQDAAITTYLTAFESNNPGTVNHLTNTITLAGFELVATPMMRRSDTNPDYTNVYIRCQVLTPSYIAKREGFRTNIKETQAATENIRTAYNDAIAYPATAYTSNYQQVEDLYLEADSPTRWNILAELKAIQDIQDQLTAARATFFAAHGIAYTTNRG